MGRFRYTPTGIDRIQQAAQKAVKTTDPAALILTIRREIATSTINALLEAGLVVDFPEYTCVLLPSKKETNLPVPRLQLKWEELPEEEQGGGYTHICFYQLILPATQTGSKGSEEAVNLGITRAGSGRPLFPLEENGSGIIMPGYDGPKAKRTASVLNLPLWAVYKNHRTEIQGKVQAVWQTTP